MKQKNIVLSIVILACAVGSSIANKLMVFQPTWVKGINQLNIPTCSTIGFVCNVSASTTMNCEVIVELINGTMAPTTGYATNICTTPLKTTSVHYYFFSNLKSVEPYHPF